MSATTNAVNKKHYDVIVIGAGAGLPKLARPATQIGLKVALCEKGPLGGTCLNRGCIPSKMLIHPADLAVEIDEAPRIDIDPSGYKVNFANLVNRVTSVIDDDANSIIPGVQNNKLMDWYKQPARFIAPKTLQINDHEEEDQKTVITGDRIFIAAGGRPRIPDIEGLAGTPFMTSTEALRNPVQPKKLLVIGGGYISTELSHYYASLGTEVTLFVRSRFIGAEDDEIRQEFTRVFSARKNISVLMKKVPHKIKYENETFTATYKDDNNNDVEISGDQLLIASGIVPNTDTLAVEKGGIELRPDGFIKVNEYLETSQENVWALGDIAGNYQFRHCANFEGEYLNETVLNVDKSENGKYPIDYTGMPHAIFSNPQVAGVGMTEEEVKHAGIEYVKGVNPYSSSAMGMALRSDSGFVKLLIEKGTRKILGCHAVGPQASVLVHEVIPLFRLNGKLDDILYTIHIHPALSELVRNAARKARDALVQSGDPIPFRLTLK